MSWYDEAWGYRRQINLKGETGASINHQVLLRVAKSSSASDYDFLANESLDFPTQKNESGDLRFTDLDNNLLNFWTERVVGSGDTAVAHVWVKVAANLSSNQSIFCYFANSSATNVSDGPNTFLFFDDFDGSSIDSTNWSIPFNTGWSVSSGELRGTSSTGRVVSNTSFNANVAVETKVRIPTLNLNGFMLNGFLISSTNSVGYMIHPTTDYYRLDSGWTATGSSLGAGATDRRISVYAKSSTADIFVKTYDTNATFYSVTGLSKTLSSTPVSLGRRYDETQLGQTYNAYWDWILVRKCNDVEPTFLTAGNVEEPILTEYVLTKLQCKYTLN